MYVSGRFVLLVALGTIPVIIFSTAGAPAGGVSLLWLALCVILVALDVVLAPSPRTIRVERGDRQRTLLGSPVQVQTRLINTGSRRLRGRLRDAWQPTAGAPTQRVPINIPAQERRDITIPLLPRRRGELTSEFVVIRSQGPLGLAGRQRRIDSRSSVRVLPPFTSRRHLPSRLQRLRELDGNTSVQVRGQGTEFDSLREYVRGDDVRSIDWRATARAGSTMLRTWRPERDRHVVVLIDTGRASAARVGDGVRLDAAMEATLLLAALAQRAGDHVHLIMFDRVVRARVTGVDGPRLLPTLVDAMAPVEPTLLDTNWTSAFDQVRAVTNRPSLIVVLTAQEEPDASRDFLGNVPSLAQRATVLVGTATDTGLIDLAAHREDAATVFLAASAERTLRDAERTNAAIARAGADAIVASPEELPPRIADRYLELKALGRL